MATDTPTLSPRQRDLCNTVRMLTETLGHPPTMTEVAAVLGVHRVTALRMARAAVAKLALTHVPATNRTWRVIDQKAASGSQQTRKRKRACRS